VSRLFKVRKTAIALAAASLLGIGGSIVVAAPASAAPPVTSEFSRCNNSGPGGATIACIHATLTFINYHSYKLTNINVSDNSCDGRSAIADLYDSYQGWTGDEFKNSNGCGTSKTWPGPRTISVAGTVFFVYMTIYAQNTTGTSSVWLTGKRYNPFA
jgi:hypothetical protein